MSITIYGLEYVNIPGDLQRCGFHVKGVRKYLKIPFAECGHGADGHFDLEKTKHMTELDPSIFGSYECIGASIEKDVVTYNYTWKYPELARVTMETRAEVKTKTAADLTYIEEKTILDKLPDADAIKTTITTTETAEAVAGIGVLTIAGFAINFLLRKFF